MERLKSKAFWAMILIPVMGALSMYLSGQMDLTAAIGAAVSGILSGVLGITQPQPARMLVAAKGSEDE